MPGPTAWQQFAAVVVSANVSVPDDTEKVIATLAGINSRSVGAPITLMGAATFDVQAATTAIALRIRKLSLTGTLLGQAATIGNVAAQVTGTDGCVGAVDTPAGEYANQTYVLTIKSTNAGAAWNVTYASLSAAQ